MQSRDEFKKSQAALVRERNQHVRTLVNFATNVDTDYNKALAASAALRFNIFEEGRQLHSFHMWYVVSLTASLAQMPNCFSSRMSPDCIHVTRTIRHSCV
jgi:hypothetical protein